MSIFTTENTAFSISHFSVIDILSFMFSVRGLLLAVDICYYLMLCRSEPIHADPVMVVERQRRVKGTDKQKKNVDVESQRKESTRVEKDSVTTLVVEASENSKNVFAKRPLETMVDQKKDDCTDTSESSKVSGRARAQSDPTSKRRGHRAVKDTARDGFSKIVRREIPKTEDILKRKKIPTPHIPRALQPSRKQGSSV